MIQWGYIIATVYLALGCMWLLTMRLYQAWFLELLDRLEEMEPGFREGAFEQAMCLGNDPQEIEMKANVLIVLSWPMFMAVYAFLYIAVRKFERYQDQMYYIDEKAESLWEAEEVLVRARESGDADAIVDAEMGVEAAKMNFEGARRVLLPAWYERLYERLRYGKVPKIEMGERIFNDDGTEKGRVAFTPAAHGCPAHTMAVLSCPDCRALPEVQKVVDELKRDGVLASVTPTTVTPTTVVGGIFSDDPIENEKLAQEYVNRVAENIAEGSMPKLEGNRERRLFRLDFDENGRVGKWTVEQPQANGSVANCCIECAQSDQSAQVTDASENLKHFLGVVHARSAFLERDTKTVFTTDGKSGFVIGVLVRDVC